MFVVQLWCFTESTVEVELSVSARSKGASLWGEEMMAPKKKIVVYKETGEYQSSCLTEVQQDERKSPEW